MADLRQPVWLTPEEVPPLPAGWVALPTAEACIQLKPGKLFDSKTVSTTGSVPVLNQSESGALGFHDEVPGVNASPSEPVVTFANHTCAVRLMKEPFSVIQNIFPKVGKPGVTDTTFFYYASLGRVSLTDYKGHHPTFRQAHIPVPPIPTQRRIASILSAYDELIENSQRRINILEAMARALYREWFVHFRFPGHESVPRVPSPLGDIPQGWEVGRLDDVLVLQRGFDLPKADRVEGSIPIYAATGVAGFHNEAKVKAPGVVTGRSGTIGEVMYVQEDFWPLNTALWVKAFPRSEPLYAFYLLSSIELKKFNSGAAVPTLNRNDIHSLEIVIPPSNLQQEFQEVASTMLKQSRTLADQIQNLRRTRDLLLPRLLSGQIDVEAMPS